MPIRFTAVGGPLDGQSFEFGKGKTSITIGRFEDRDIRFPPDFRSISRAHLTIVVENDRYYLRPDESVYVDGQEAMRDDELPRRCELRIGSLTGPMFKVEWTILSDVPSTQHAPRSPRAARQSPHRAALRATHRARLIAFAAVALVMFVAAGAIAYVLLQPEPISARLAAARPSVYLVVLRNQAGFERGFGTAWVIAPGTLATNAHVVAGIEEAKASGQKAFVRANVAPYATYEIVSAVSHPHYQLFTTMVRTYAPVAPGGRLVQSMTGYDVGLLKVAPSAYLAPPLKLATNDTLNGLDAGDEVGYVGYPSERMAAGGVNVAEPTPTTQIGRITAMTDFFLVVGDPSDRLLIQHSMSSTGGSSGSPVFNSRGEVIGIHNAGNMMMVQSGSSQARIPTILVNFAQRADIVRELLEARVETISLTRTQQWRRRLEALPSAPDYLIREFARDMGEKDLKPVLQTTLSLVKKSGTTAQAEAEFDIPGAGNAFFVAVGPDPQRLVLQVLDREDNKSLGVKADGAHYPWLRLQPTQPAKVIVRVSRQVDDAVPRAALLRIYFVQKKS